MVIGLGDVSPMKRSLVPGLRHSRWLRNSWLHPRYIGTRYIRDSLVRAIAYARGRLIDIGCGRKPYEDLFRAAVTSHVGIDWPVHLDRSRADIVADALRLPIANCVADTVLATELMEHLPSPSDFLREIFRILRPDGAVIMTVPFLEPLHETPRDFFRFTPFSLRQLFGEAGFEVREVWPRGGWWSVVVGSFLAQLVYDFANPTNAKGERRRPLVGAFALPVCAALQASGFVLDKVSKHSGYTLGYTIVAIRPPRTSSDNAAS